MEEFFALVVIPLAVFWLIGWGIVRAVRQSRRLKELELRFDVLEDYVVQHLRDGGAAAKAKAADQAPPDSIVETVPVEPAPEPQPQPKPEVKAAEPEAEAEAATDAEEAAAGKGAAEDSAAPDREPERIAAREATAPAAKQSRWDASFAENWLVWLGGIALALGGVFIVKYSIDNGFLGPWARIIAGLVAGVAMVGAGEWARRQPVRGDNPAAWGRVPLALVGAGLLTVYGAIYAGFGFYGLYPPVVTLILMALTSAAGLAYSLLLGPWMAGLAMLGAYIVPLLVGSRDPSTELLFLYLTAVLAGSLWLLRYRPWMWGGLANLGASAVWFLLWYSAELTGAADLMVVELYGLAVMGLFVFFFLNHMQQDDYAGPMDALRLVTRPLSASFILHLAFVGVAAAGVMLAVHGDHAPLASLLVYAVPVMAALLAWREPRLELMVVVSLVAGLLFMGLWPVDYQEQDTMRYVTTALLLGVFYGAYGLWRVQSGILPVLGAAEAVAGPILLFCVAYWHFNRMGTAPEWALIALILAAGYVAAASFILRGHDGRVVQSVVAVFAIGATSGLSLALAAALEKEWLTIAFALQVAAIAVIHSRLPLAAFRHLAGILILIVIVRLELDSAVVRAFFSWGVPVEWYFYGFGVPILAFAFAWHLFRREKTDYVVTLLESGVLLFWVTFVALTVRQFAGVLQDAPGQGAYTLMGYSFAELSIHVASLLANALGLYWLNGRNRTVVRDWGWRILGVAGLVLLVGFGLLLANPFLNYTGSVGSMIVIDWLMLLYLVPAGMFLWFGRIADPRHQGLARILAMAAGGLVLFYLTTEVRHAFRGHDLTLGYTSEMEFYTYSLVWILYASLALLLGIVRDNTVVKKAAFVLVLLTVAKVFVLDMAALKGLLRAVSFLGLGGCLIGLAILYQRFGKSAPAHKNAPEQQG
ncbi:DUF2339 domain-containing protein [Sneathiella chinensis]|uniref:Membrane protein n=2 Tax=Alphaproteobacteria TaxID=28211 RepID=A0ABQ5U7Y3_9PROT|nr:DUF2339 domain-containing protein [Sneathiella chinensis]GLQ07437.1 membrane protein [Sneathiella chinensis]